MLLNKSCLPRNFLDFSLTLLLIIVLSSALLPTDTAHAAEESPAATQNNEDDDELKFRGEDSNNKLVYHFNKSDESYQ